MGSQSVPDTVRLRSDPPEVRVTCRKGPGSVRGSRFSFPPVFAPIVRATRGPGATVRDGWIERRLVP